jgi:DNA-binding transcriptional LysR family regulator
MTLKKLEASVGAPLFVRAVRGTGSELTPSGQELIALYEELSTVIARIQRAFPGLVNGLSEG